MHRHGYQGRKFGRQRDQREALMRNLAEALILNESVVTTSAKAKELRRYTERLITQAKDATLASRRLLIGQLGNKNAVNRLIEEISPKLKQRSSGYLRIKQNSERRGDSSQLATISFVDDLKLSKQEQMKASQVVDAKTKPSEAHPTVMPQANEPIRQSQPQPQSNTQAPKRTGFRGNR